MRASKLLGSVVVDRAGRRVGTIRDVRVTESQLHVVGLVVGDGLLARPAHGWGFVEGRTSGPWLLRKLLDPAARRARFVPAADVVEWGPGTVTISRETCDLRHPHDAGGT